MGVRTVRSSPLLWFGFGGLLCLLAFAGLYGLSTIRYIGTRNEEIRESYLHQDRILQQIRADLYLSGTYIRNLLLEPDAHQAQLYRTTYLKTRDQIRTNCKKYGRLLGSKQRSAFTSFDSQTERYFNQIEPVLTWSAKQRQGSGMAFMKDILLSERAFLVQLADQLALADARQLEAGSHRVANLLQTLNTNLIVFTIGSLGVGVSLALFTTRRVLRLEGLTQTQLHELQDLSSRLVQAQESERRAIARELHDEVGQSVSGLLLGIGNVATSLSPEENSSVLLQLHDLRHLAERTVSSVRNLSLLLRPSMLDDLGLVPALQWQAREVSRTANINVEVTAEDLPEENVPEDVKICIYRIVQEALKNVSRHARATTVEIQLSRGPDQVLRLIVEDNGRGFAPREKGLGLLGMEERVRHLHGIFQIQSELGQGTKLSIYLPT